MRGHARERRTDLALAAGRTGELVPELEQRVRDQPYRERGWEQLALTLYRSGRQAEALDACRRARAVLVEDLGVEPGPGLQTLQDRLLYRALVEPAAAAGLRLEPDLVDTIMADVTGQAEPLPLLSEAMVRTWQNREGDLLTLEGYRRAGELAGALEAAAEESFGALTDDARIAATSPSDNVTPLLIDLTHPAAAAVRLPAQSQGVGELAFAPGNAEIAPTPGRSPCMA